MYVGGLAVFILKDVAEAAVQHARFAVTQRGRVVALRLPAPAGFDNVQGVVTAAYTMDPTDPTWAEHEDMKIFTAWMAKYHPTAHLADLGNANGYTVSCLMAETLRRCGSLLTRENVMKQAASFTKFRVPMLLPGITVTTSPTDYYPIQAVQLQRFKGQTWELFGEIMHAESS